MSRWKLVTQKSVFRAKLFNVKEVIFKNKAGREKYHHIVDKAPTISVFPLTDTHEIYLISQYRYMLNSTVLEAVAGYVGKGETTINAAKRELKEETGISAHQLEEIARVEVAGSVIKSKMYLFLAKELEIGENKLDEDEEIEVVKMPLESAVEKVMIGEINHAASMLGILLLDKLRMQKKL